LISIHFVNAIERPPIVLDMVTSGVAHGKIRVVRNKEEKVAPGLLVNEHGQLTTDPNVMFTDGARGSLLPMGLHKGYGLAVICELLAGALTGGGVHREGMNITNTIINNMLVIIIDPARVAEGDTFAPYVDAFVDWVKESPAADPDAPVLVPGDPERQRREERLAGGIPLDENTWQQILAAGENVGLERAALTALATD
jgi:uncharacterized oxidoreductase